MISILSKSEINDLPPVRVVYEDSDIEKVASLIKQSLKSGTLTQGPLVRAFEEELSGWVNNTPCVAVNSATSGLEIILRALEVTGREVIVPANTFVATAAAAIHAGATVKFVDIELGTYSIDPTALRKAISPKTVAVMVVHIGGIISDNIEEIREICRDNGLFLIEDAAQALGSYFKEKSAATFGDAGAFSFFPTKIISTGEGGMIATSDKDLKEKALVLRNHGKNRQEECVALGYNWRMSEINAALGLVHIKKLKKFISIKEAVAVFFDEALSGVPGVTITSTSAYNQPNHYKYIVLLDKGISKQKLKETLKENYKISLSGAVFPEPCPSLKIFDNREKFPAAEEFCRRHICLPIYADMSIEEAEYVTEALKNELGERNRVFKSAAI